MKEYFFAINIVTFIILLAKSVKNENDQVAYFSNRF